MLRVVVIELLRPEQPGEGLSLNVPFLTVVGEGKKGWIYRVDDRTPHALFPASLLTVADTASALTATLGLTSPSEQAIVETSGYAGAPGEPEGGRTLQAGAGAATIVSYAPNEVTLSVSGERPGLLFVSEIYHPSWRASVDGKEVPIYRMNVAFRAVPMPAGQHELVFRYRSSELWIGGTTSAATLLLTLTAIGALALRRRRGARADPAP